jgi:hypothetical protein
MTNEYVTIKIYLKTRRKLRLLAAMKDKRMGKVIDELVTHELTQLQQKERGEHGDQPNE